MRTKPAIHKLLVVALCFFTVSTQTLWAVSEKVVHAFTSSKDGQYSYAALIFDSAGNLYGTTGSGGTYNCGTVFEETPGSNGWTESVVYAFNGVTDGCSPAVASVLIDPSGNLYGTTYSGGTYDYGTVFELSKGENGAWTESVLYSFNGQDDGALPYAGLTFDALGNLYGTTYSGGTFANGTAFELMKQENGNWTETVLHNFSGGSDGSLPYAGLIFDSSGNLYGTTIYGGTGNLGTVFELQPNGDGTWAESILFNFIGGAGGSSPQTGLIFDQSGKLYGTTGEGGNRNGAGVVFQLTKSGGTWIEKVLWAPGGKDGYYPSALAIDSAGNLFGTNEEGGASKGAGTIFEILRRNGKAQVLYTFPVKPSGLAPYGDYPYGGVVLDASGNLYGTTGGGGSGQSGTIFELSSSSSLDVLHTFASAPGGIDPSGSLIADSAGNLYGTTGAGGPHNSGTVFEISPGADGQWVAEQLYAFTGASDGGYPTGSLTMDSSGNLYGATFDGGTRTPLCTDGCGTLFELTPVSSGPWKETVLHSFAGGEDGGQPAGGLVFDSSGNLYGTVSYAGPGGGGYVFELTPAGENTWTLTVLASYFDDGYPEYGVVFDSAGHLYGTTSQGGAYEFGNVFELSPGAGGMWMVSFPYDFTGGSDGRFPQGQLTVDSNGNLYGSTSAGGAYGFGVVFQLAPSSGGLWTENILHSFEGSPSDGRFPNGNLLFDSSGDLYGTTQSGGPNFCATWVSGCGTVFALSPKASGTWKETIIHNFAGRKDGGDPAGGLIFESSGDLFGLAGYGKYNSGVVYEVSR